MKKRAGLRINTKVVRPTYFAYKRQDPGPDGPPSPKGKGKKKGPAPKGKAGKKAPKSGSPPSPGTDGPGSPGADGPPSPGTDGPGSPGANDPSTSGVDATDTSNTSQSSTNGISINAPAVPPDAKPSVTVSESQSSQTAGIGTVLGNSGNTVANPIVIVKSDNTGSTNAQQSIDGATNQNNNGISQPNSSNTPTNPSGGTPAIPPNNPSANSTSINPALIVGITVGALVVVVGASYYARNQFRRKYSIFDVQEENVDIFGNTEPKDLLPPLSSMDFNLLSDDFKVPDDAAVKPNHRYGYAGSVHLSEMIDSSRGSLGTMSTLSAPLPFPAYIDINQVGQRYSGTESTSNSSGYKSFTFSAYFNTSQGSSIRDSRSIRPLTHSTLNSRTDSYAASSEYLED
ncbi:hypothetical protein HDV04_001955 [Boothiomyces sp. JEL0838]|nr:hypothetical protein HDV04_001955 [Boothiomyces sp. JEL0838]